MGYVLLNINNGIYLIHFKPSNVCALNSFNNIVWNRCLREFFALWSQVILLKMCLLIIMPLVVLIGGEIKKKICKKM